MYRQSSESYGFNDSPSDVNTIDGTDFDGNVLNRSINSRGSSTGNASGSSSKAVLAALRALQDKIRRLESERAQALDETVQLRYRIKNQEIESEHLKQKDNLLAQKSLHEVRIAHERILTEKTETEIRLSKLEERYREEQQIAADLRLKLESFENEKLSNLQLIKNFELERNLLQDQVQHIQQKENDLSQSILWKTKRQEADIDELTRKFSSLQNDFTSVLHEKTVVETKFIELDQLVGQLLAVNESLVVRLSGKPFIKEITLKNGAAKKKKTIVASTKIAPPTPSADPRRVSFDEAKNLHGLHRMYVKLARGVSDATGNDTAEKIVKPTRAVSSGNQMKSATLIGSRKAQENRSIKSDYDTYNDTYDIHIPSVIYEPRHREANEDSVYNDGQHSFSSSRYSTEFKGPQPQNRDVEDVILSLEEEFSDLNDQYRSLISSAHAQSSSHLETKQADDFVAVIKKLHRKGEQLRALKTTHRR